MPYDTDSIEKEQKVDLEAEKKIRERAYEFSKERKACMNKIKKMSVASKKDLRNRKIG